MRVLRAIVFLLAVACVVVFFSHDGETTVTPSKAGTETHTEIRVGFQPSPWLTFEKMRREEPIVLTDGRPSKAITTSERRSIAFAAWSWAFAGGAVLLFILAKVLGPKP